MFSWAPGDYENWGDKLIKLGGGAQSKSGEAPMVKIKDFTLASQNRGGGHLTPRALHTGRPCMFLNV